MAAEETPESLPQLSRSLLTPGPQPPVSHFGLTLLRHVVATALRYSLYQLGMPVPDAPPIRILSLRLYLEATPLRALLGDLAGGERLLAALLQPSAGVSATLPTSIRTAAALPVCASGSVFIDAGEASASLRRAPLESNCGARSRIEYRGHSRAWGMPCWRRS